MEDNNKMPRYIRPVNNDMDGPIFRYSHKRKRYYLEAGDWEIDIVIENGKLISSGHLHTWLNNVEYMSCSIYGWYEYNKDYITIDVLNQELLYWEGKMGDKCHKIKFERSKQLLTAIRQIRLFLRNSENDIEKQLVNLYQHLKK